MKNEISIEDKVNQALDESVDDLSPDVRRRLNQARITAIQSKPKLSGYWKAATAMSLVLVVSLSYHFSQNLSSAQYQQDDLVTPFAEVLDEDLQMLEELEFAYWLAEESDNAAI